MNSWLFGGEVRAQAQVTSLFALEGRAAVSLRRAPETGLELAQNLLEQNYGARLVASVVAKVDLMFGFDVLVSDGGQNTTQWNVGFAGRLP